MKRKVRGAMALIMALIMSLSLGVSASADTSVPSSADTFTALIYGVESGADVTAYQAVSAVYGTYGLMGYETADGVSIADIESPTASEINAIAKDITNGAVTLTSAALTEAAGSDGTAVYSADLSAGLWIVLVTGTVDTVYNPMIVSGYYTDANDSTLTTSGVSAEDDFVESAGGETSVAYAKSSSIPFDKTVTDASGGTYADSTSLSVGDIVYFRIETTIPSYSAAYADGVIFTITDTLSAGLDALDEEENDIVVTVGEETASEGSDYTVSISARKLTIAFDYAYAYANAGKDVVVTYSTTLNRDASSGSEGNSNTASLTYSNAPTVFTDTDGDGVPDTPDDPSINEETGDTALVYTFAITDELVKVSEGGTVSGGTEEGDQGDVTVTQALSGAVFTIYTDAACTQVYTNADNTIGSVISDANGMIKFSGLGTGTYYIKETNAPDGYQSISTVYRVTISAVYDTDGVLEEYSIVINDGESDHTSTYSIAYESDGTKTVSAQEDPAAVVNSPEDTGGSDDGTTGGEPDEDTPEDGSDGGSTDDGSGDDTTGGGSDDDADDGTSDGGTTDDGSDDGTTDGGSDDDSDDGTSDDGSDDGTTDGGSDDDSDGGTTDDGSDDDSDEGTTTGGSDDTTGLSGFPSTGDQNIDLLILVTLSLSIVLIALVLSSRKKRRAGEEE